MILNKDTANVRTRTLTFYGMTYCHKHEGQIKIESSSAVNFSW